MDVLKKFYQNKTNEIKTKYESVKSLMEHNGEKGSENETILMNFLQDFLPKNYSIGKGFIIDKDGNLSNQCDLVIYDNQYNPNLMKFENNNYFPIESVYCVIEVKTTLRLADIKKSFDDLQKMNSLNFVEEELMYSKNTSFMWTKTERPFYILFAYDTDYKTSEGLLNAFKDLGDGVFFEIAFILNIGIIRKINHDNKKILDFVISPILDSNKKIIALIPSYPNPNITINDISYPVFSDETGKFPVDYIRNFLLFLYMLNDIITTKKIGNDYLSHYFPLEDPIINPKLILETGENNESNPQSL